LPSLPEIFDATLKAGVFIHHGVTSGNATDLSYERLEWVGDAYLYITATLLISKTFPGLLPGKCSQMRERIVKNVQLAEYAKQYGFDERAKLPDASMGNRQTIEKTKMLGDIFEAYVAAIILSDPANGVARCTEWLKAVWSMTLEKDIRGIEQEPKVDSPLWRLRGKDPVQKSEPRKPQDYPAKDRLRILICSPGIELNYRDCAPERKDPATKLPVFTIGVFLTGWGETDKQLGFGSAHGKKDAGQKAAEMALANTKLMNVYAEKKKLFDAQKELERKALEGLE
jgi:ribonuclease-3